MKDDLIDIRQRLAAATILLAVDFPAEMSAYSKLMRLAGQIVGNKVGIHELKMGKGRRRALEHARDLINAMLSEGETSHENA